MGSAPDLQNIHRMKIISGYLTSPTDHFKAKRSTSQQSKTSLPDDMAVQQHQDSLRTQNAAYAVCSSNRGGIQFREQRWCAMKGVHFTQTVTARAKLHQEFDEVILGK